MRDNGRRPAEKAPELPLLTADELLAAALKTAKHDVAQACLDNRGALECAVQAFTIEIDGEFSEGARDGAQRLAGDLKYILAALDVWRDASAVLMQNTANPIIPPGFEERPREVN